MLRTRKEDSRKTRFGVEDQKFSFGHALLRWLSKQLYKVGNILLGRQADATEFYPPQKTFPAVTMV